MAKNCKFVNWQRTKTANPIKAKNQTIKKTMLDKIFMIKKLKIYYKVFLDLKLNLNQILHY